MRERLTPQQRATDLINLIRPRMLEAAINISVLDDTATAISAAMHDARAAALAEAEKVCRDISGKKFLLQERYVADQCRKAIAALGKVAA